jgi:hypothetical protein
MSVLMDMHQDHVARRLRLGMPVMSRRSVREAVAALPPPKPRPAPDLWGCPVNLYGLPSPRLIIKLVALKHGVSVATMLGPSRSRPMVAARYEAIGLIYTHCRAMSLLEMGRLFGGRDHTSILHALRKMRLAGRPVYRVIPSIHGYSHPVEETFAEGA